MSREIMSNMGHSVTARLKHLAEQQHQRFDYLLLVPLFTLELMIGFPFHVLPGFVRGIKPSFPAIIGKRPGRGGLPYGIVRLF